MNTLKLIRKRIADIVEVYLPETVFMALFLAFLINVFFRYALKDPQNWTFELSILAFVIVGLLGASAAYREEDHVVFDLVYANLGEKGKNIFRIIGYIVVIVLFSIALPGTVRYLMKLRAVTSIMKIPLKYVFSVFPILLFSSIVRSAYRLILDFKAYRNKTYVQTYNKEPKERLI